MANFIGWIVNDRGKESSRLSSKFITTEANAWNFGIRTFLRKEDDGSLTCIIEQTGGSKDSSVKKTIKSMTIPDVFNAEHLAQEIGECIV